MTRPGSEDAATGGAGSATPSATGSAAGETLEVDIAVRYPAGPEIRAAFTAPAAGFCATVLFGPSGCGKTTVLRCLAGLERPVSGSIRFRGETWDDATRGVHLPPQRRVIGLVSQDYSLFPHLSVADNVAFGIGDLPAAERARRVGELLERFGLAALADRKPAKISGGQQQRTALARAVARRPRLLLMDEPLSALDAPTREHLRRDLRRLLAGSGIPVVVVTHDRIEALSLGDRLVVMRDGRVCQAGPVNEVFRRPTDAGVARIVGVETVESARIVSVRDGLAVLAVGTVELTALAAGPGAAGLDGSPGGIGAEGAGLIAGGEATVCIRAEDVLVERAATTAGGAGAGSARNRLSGRVESLSPEGPMVRLQLDVGFRLGALVTARSVEELGLQPGVEVTALLKAPAVHVVARG